MVQSSASEPGQFAAGLKKAATASREGSHIPPELLGLKHGHEDDEAPTETIPVSPPWPEHLLGPRPEQ